MSELAGTFDTIAERRRSHGMSVWRKMWVHRMGIVGIAIMLAFVIGALFGTWLAPKDPVAIESSEQPGVTGVDRSRGGRRHPRH